MIQQQRKELNRERLRIEASKETKADYALSRLYISNFQGINELLIEALPLNTQWIFLTGENGFGKTSILRAIAKGLVGDEDLIAPLSNDAKIFTNGLCGGKPFMYEAKPKTKPEFVIPLAAYGVSRFLLSARDQDVSDLSKQSTYSLFYDNGQLINIERTLIDSERDDKPTFDKLVTLFKTIVPNLMDIRSELINKKRQIRYYEKSNNGKSYQPVTLNDLAAGYRSILTMIGDMVIRLSEIEGNSIDDLKGIVLIDEIDAHLHPKYQYELPKLLSEAFPKVQFIATTHSPIPLLGLPESNKPVILTVDRTLEEGITIDKKADDFDIRKLNLSALLTSPIFGFYQILARGAKADDIIPVDNFEEVLDIAHLKTRLKNLREAGLVK